MKRAARRNLAVSATNALLEHGMPRLLEDLDPSERGTGDFHAPRMRVNFFLDGVPCCATSKPAGYGEEKIAVIYDTNSVDPAIIQTVLDHFALPLPRGTRYTATSFWFEREYGPYVQIPDNDKPSAFYFRTASSDHLRTLCNLDVTPNGFGASGPVHL